MKTLKEQRDAIRQAALQIEKEVKINGKDYDESTKAEMMNRVLAMRDALETLKKLEDTKNFLKDLL